MNLLFASSIEVSVSASVLSMTIQDWFPLGLIDWFDLLAVQDTLYSLIQHQNSKAPIFQCSVFLMVQLIFIHDPSITQFNYFSFFFLIFKDNFFLNIKIISD